DRIAKETKDIAAWEAIVALCKTDAAAARASSSFGRGDRDLAQLPTPALLNYLRTLQLLLVHTSERPPAIHATALRCNQSFPHTDWRVNRELAILLTEFRRKGLIDAPIEGRLLDALLAAKADRQQQIHYFYCLRLLHQGWTGPQKQALLDWYEGTKTWM